MRIVFLDLIRFVAALAVVLYHYTARGEGNTFQAISEITKFGYLGVPLFFIISGYVIALSASNRTALQFAVSRFVRLYPTFWVGITVTVVITSLFGPGHYSIEQVAANLTMVNDYFGFDNIDGVYWTLQAELKFYACVCVLLFLGVYEKNRVWLSLWLALTVLHLMSSQPYFLGWFISPYYSSFFIAGIAFYLIQKEGENSFNLFVLVSSLLISSVRVVQQAAGFIANPDTMSLSIAVAIIVLAYVTFYMLATKKIQLAPHRHYVTLGGLTYPLYLIHSQAGRVIIDGVQGFVSVGMAVFFTTALMLCLSYLIYVFFEKKLIAYIKAQLL